MIERRAFLRAAGLAVLVAPLDSRAQAPGKTRVIGFLGGASAAGYTPLVESLRLGLRDHGYVEGKNLRVEYRWAEGDYDRLPALAGELVRLKVDLIVTQGTPAAFAAKGATSTIPIVMAIVGNPVESGVVASYARPGGNVTGSSFFWGDLNAKRLEFLKTLSPRLARAAVLINPDNLAMAELLRAMEERAQALKVNLQPLNVRRLDELPDAFQVARKQAEALIVPEDGLFQANAGRLAELANKHVAQHDSGRTARPVACWPMASTSRSSGGRARCSSTRSSRAPSRPTCPSSRRLGLSWSSTSRLPERSD